VLWSLFKIVLFILLVAVLALGAGWMVDLDGGVRIAVANTEFTLGPLQTLILGLILLVAVWAALKLLGIAVALFRFLNGDETALSRYFDRNRERRGFAALADGLMALSSGEGRVAMAKAEQARRYLGRPELTNLIVAQAAEMTGDKRRAEKVYKELLADDSTRFVGVRGLMKQRLAEGDTETALKLAEKAFALKPKHAETQDVLLRLQAGNADWTGARKTLGAKLRHGLLPRDVHRRRDAVLALSEARDIIDDGQPIEAREAAIEANRLSPDLIPAAAMAARQYTANQQARYATRVIRKAWDVAPHPELAAAFADIQPDETPQERLLRFQPLFKLHPDHGETRLLQAELNIAAEDFPGARRALGDLATSQPSARALTIMAAIERGEGADDAVVRAWLTRALTAPRGPQWVCDNCHWIEGQWQPVCSNCGALDSLSWREPPESDGAMPASTAMLPLLVGEPAPEPAAEAEEVPAAEAFVPVDDGVADDIVGASADPATLHAVIDGEAIEETDDPRP